MRSLGLLCKVRRSKRYNSYQGEQGTAAPNLLNREFDATAPNQKWVTDVTEFNVGDRKLYFSPVNELLRPPDHLPHRGQVPEPGTDQHLIAPGPELSAARSATARAFRPGFQYRHSSWRTLLQNAGAVQSISRKGNCYDNAVMESFFSHLKEELFHHVRFLSTDALETALHEYISWCNTDRISTKLKGLSPVQYRAQALAV